MASPSSVVPAAPAQVQAAPAEIKLNVYFSNPSSLQVISSRGKSMHFLGGRYTTKDEGEIRDLEAMAERQNGTVFKNPNMLQMSEAELDPMSVLKARFFKEFQEQQAANLNPEQDFGASIQERLRAASTSSIQAVTVK